MKLYNKTLLTSSLVLLLNNTLFAMPSGEALFIDKCTSCHSIDMPKSKAGLKAPPAVGLMFHLTENLSNEASVKEHIQSFTMNPTEEKAVCKSINKFGLMPSQKANVTEEELRIIADWLVDDVYISRRSYKKKKKKMFAN